MAGLKGYAIEWRWNPEKGGPLHVWWNKNEWRVHARYETEKQRAQAMTQLRKNRGDMFEYRKKQVDW